MCTSMTLSSDVDRDGSSRRSRASIGTRSGPGAAAGTRGARTRARSAYRPAAARLCVTISSRDRRRAAAAASLTRPRRAGPDRASTLRGERLDEVTSAPLSRPSPIFEGVARREHEHRGLVAALPQRLSIEDRRGRQHQVEQNDVEALGVEPKERALAGMLTVTSSVRPRTSLKERWRLCVVLDDKDRRRAPGVDPTWTVNQQTWEFTNYKSVKYGVSSLRISNPVTLQTSHLVRPFKLARGILTPRPLVHQRGCRLGRWSPAG